MSSSLKVLITGASSGFGYEIAQKLANDGHHIFASMRGIKDKNAGAAHKLEQWASERNVSIKTVELDVTNEAYSDFNKDQEVMFGKAMADLESEGALQPVWIADVIKKLVDMPVGKRPLRTVVGTVLTAGVRKLNEYQDAAQREFLSDVGLESWNKG